jgi:hypothetical protein
VRRTPALRTPLLPASTDASDETRRAGLSARRTSLGGRLTRLIVLTSSTTLLVGAVLFAWYTWSEAKAVLTRDVHLVAGVLGSNLRPALEFEDARFATEELAKLERQPHILAARLYAVSGKPLAQWQRPGTGPPGLSGVPGGGRASAELKRGTRRPASRTSSVRDPPCG